MSLPKAKINHPGTIIKAYQFAKTAANHAAQIAPVSVSVSSGNSKIGTTANVSLPPVYTCNGCCGSCAKYCYAVSKYVRLGVDFTAPEKNAWNRNLIAYLQNPQEYFTCISKRCYFARFFRWHVSGEIIGTDYFAGMVQVARENPHCRFLAFTKRYEIVNAWISANGESVNELPENMSVVYSYAPGLDMVNPYGLPECHIRFADIPENEQSFYGRGRVYECSGHCEKCQNCGAGCWFAHHGDIIVINQH